MTPLSLSGLNQTSSGLLLTSYRASAPPGALSLSASNFSSPFSPDGVQCAQPLLPGQPLPTGVAAVAMAVAAEQPEACVAFGTGGRVPATYVREGGWTC